MPDLRCPKCNRKLAEIEDSYLDNVDEETANQNKKLFIKCPKCKEIIEL